MRFSSCAVVVAVLLPAACSRHDGDADARAATVASGDAPPAAAAADDVRIVSGDSSVDLALVRDSISAGLSQKTLATVRHSVDTATVKSGGFAASIEKMVKSSVSSAIGTRAVFPLSAVKDVRYEDGALQFDWNGKPVQLFENTKVNGKPVLESFRPDDAQRFVDAVRARKRALGQAQ